MTGIFTFRTNSYDYEKALRREITYEIFLKTRGSTASVPMYIVYWIKGIPVVFSPQGTFSRKKHFCLRTNRHKTESVIRTKRTRYMDEKYKANIYAVKF